jgi:hypothetical protein
MSIRPAWFFALFLLSVMSVADPLFAQSIDQLRDVTNVEQLPPRASWPLLVYLVLSAVALLLLLSPVVLLRQRHRRRPSVPPEQSTLDLLAKLGEECESEEEIVRSYIALSAIVRRYLEKRFSLPAQAQTTTEFLELLPATELSPPQQTWLEGFLERCDLVKFARVVPPVEDCRVAIESARAFVMETSRRLQNYAEAQKSQASPDSSSHP